MTESDVQAFDRLFREAYRKCFTVELTAPLTEPESHHFSHDLFEKTGLVVGWKSLKNYSQFVLGELKGRPENPSTATLDTLARYVAGAPVTDEIQRKKRERHYPYWFRFKENVVFERPVRTGTPQLTPNGIRFKTVSRIAAGGLITVIVLLTVVFIGRSSNVDFVDEFERIDEVSLQNRGWRVHWKNPATWMRRNSAPGYLTLYTLDGDSWPDSGKTLAIPNLLTRDVPSGCFTTEIHLTSFFPDQNWQQAGLLLLEDTSLTGKSLRLSIGYNDFTGGFPGEREILVQAVTYDGQTSSRPEEIAHRRLFVLEKGSEPLVRQNLRHTALRIERFGDRYRLLFSNGSLKNAAFREVITTAFDLDPSRVGVFALKGFDSPATDLPVLVDAFRLSGVPCD